MICTLCVDHNDQILAGIVILFHTIGCLLIHTPFFVSANGITVKILTTDCNPQIRVQMTESKSVVDRQYNVWHFVKKCGKGPSQVVKEEGHGRALCMVSIHIKSPLAMCRKLQRR